MTVSVAFLLVLATACLSPTEGVPGTLWGMVGTAMNKIPLYEKVVSAVNTAVEWTDAFAESTSRAFGGVRSTIKGMMGDIDGPSLVAIIDPLLNKDEIISTHCLKGIKIHVGGLVVNDMVLHSGNVNFDETNFEVVGSDEERDLGDYQILQVMFQFRNLQAAYRLTINTLYRGDLQGFIVFEFKGISSMIIEVKVPTERKRIEELLNVEHKCFMEVQEIIAELSSDMEIADSDYNSILKGATGQGVTQYFSINKLINEFDSITVLKRTVGKTLLKMLEPILKDRELFCAIEDMPVIETPSCLNTEVYRLEVRQDGRIKNVKP